MIVPRQELLMSKEAVFVYTASMGIATLALSLGINQPAPGRLGQLALNL
jgi:hypothetical protein